MKPESMRNGPSVPRTSWVWAWPPNRSADSKSVTSWVADRTWAAVRPDTPAPTTAAVGRDGPWIERGTEASCMSCGPGWFGTTLRPDWRVSAARRVMPGTLSILRPHRMVVVKGVSKVWRGYGDRAIGDGRPAGRSRVRLPQRLHDDDTRYRNTSSFLGRQTRLDYPVTERVPEQRFALRGENPTVVAHDTMTFVGQNGSTTVTYRADFEFKGIARLVAPLLAPALKKLGDDAEKGMREALERLE